MTVDTLMATLRTTSASDSIGPFLIKTFNGKVLEGAGLTDTAIAGRVSLSQRTVQRRIRALMEQAGVRNRFGLGAVLERRGLMPGWPRYRS
ncbi:hypothetical protein SRB5_13450 [Streptomyces sp. RB5]|uniref:Uncharacterized protein n=1 Tax=Streptomyces smaragdinus TaxID=2585196 RepID=A0A7K0CCP2_9ACTN|nr:hypothetical protein [Streptomyces smaragdinus]MQY11230.1 hypothetical protein [Streptomyces smaragdinus]